MNGTISLRRQEPTRWLTVTAMLMALNIVMSSFGIAVPGGHLYLNDIIICTASILLDPFGAFLAGGVGAFLGDFFFYPTPMFVSLITHGLQAVVISLFVHKNICRKESVSLIVGLFLGTVINVVGYSFGRAFVYATVSAAMLKLPFQIFQASFGAIAAGLLCTKGGIIRLWKRFTLAEA